MSNIENLDFKTDQKLKSCQLTIEKLKGNKKLIQDFIKQSEKLKAAYLAISLATRQWADNLARIGELHYEDLGTNITQLCDSERSVADSFDAIAASIQGDIIQPLDQNIEPSMKELDNFEKDLNKSRKDLQSDLKKLEGNTKKVAKKGDAMLLQAMKDFNAKREEIDRFKSDMLKKVFILERHNFGHVLDASSKLCTKQTELSGPLGNIQSNLPQWQSLLSTLDSLSDEQIAALSLKAEAGYQKLNTSEPSNVTLTDATNKFALINPSNSTSGGPPPNFSPPPPLTSSGGPPPPNFTPPPPKFNPPPPNSTPPNVPSPRGKAPPKVPSVKGSPSTPKKFAPPPPLSSTPPPPPGGGPPPPPSGGPPPPPSGGPPPPPSGGPPPPPPSSSSSKSKSKGKSSGGGGNDRNKLLGSINDFKKSGLKKAVTNDRSAPVLTQSKSGGGGMGMPPPMF